MFLGAHEASLDAKNRVAFPARLRERLPEAERRTVILTKHGAGCIGLYPLSAFERMARFIEEKRRASADWDDDAERELYANSERVDVDAVGRILIPEKLRAWAGLEKNVVFLGRYDRIEIWDAARWKASRKKREQSFGKYGKGLVR